MDIRIGYFIKSPVIGEECVWFTSNKLYEVKGITMNFIRITDDGGLSQLIGKKDQFTSEQWQVIKPVGFQDVKEGDWIDTGVMHEYYHAVTKGELYKIEWCSYKGVELAYFEFIADKNRLLVATKEMWDKYGFSIVEPVKVVEPVEPVKPKQEMQPRYESYLSLMALWVDLDNKVMFNEYAKLARELEGAK